jgi:ribosomal protein S18 acetylase RimI-like enzyme
MIRKAKKDDLPKVIACATVAYARYRERLGYDLMPLWMDYEPFLEQDALWILEDERRIVGHMVAWPEDEAFLIFNLAVEPEEQHKGFGHQLLAFAEEEARRRGLTQVRLYTNEKMTENIGLYESVGYGIIRRRAHPTVAGSWLIDMEKSLE